MCLKFQNLICQVYIVFLNVLHIRSLKFKVRHYLCHLVDSVIAVLTYFLRTAKLTRNWKTGLIFAFTGKIYFRVLGLGLGSVALHIGLGLLALALVPLALLTSLILHSPWAL